MLSIWQLVESNKAKALRGSQTLELGGHTENGAQQRWAEPPKPPLNEAGADTHLEGSLGRICLLQRLLLPQNTQKHPGDSLWTFPSSCQPSAVAWWHQMVRAGLMWQLLSPARPLPDTCSGPMEIRLLLPSLSSHLWLGWVCCLDQHTPPECCRRVPIGSLTPARCPAPASSEAWGAAWASPTTPTGWGSACPSSKVI